jgi:hypothetical protein
VFYCKIVKTKGIIMKLNKSETTARILSIVSDAIRPCTKIEMNNIVFPAWAEFGLFGKIIRQCVATKEQPDGCIYKESVWRVVYRPDVGDSYDAFAWKESKVEGAKNIRPIGVNSEEGKQVLEELLSKMKNENEKKAMEEMFNLFRKDFSLVTSPSENRFYVEVTQEFYDAGITHCVDKWMEEDENGMSTATELNVGDFLIVANDGVYCIRCNEFNESHIIN